MLVDLKDIFPLTGDFNEKVLTKLLEAIKANASQEMDYLKFKKSFLSLCAMGIDEATAAKSALVTAQTMGMNTEKLMESVRFYQNILKREKEAFALALKNQIANNVDAKKMEVEKLQARKVEILTKIEKLKEELVTIDDKITGVQQQVNESGDKIESTRQQFVKTISLLEAEIEGDLEIFQRFAL